MVYGSQTTITYFRAYQNYFWRWAEQGSVIEFANQRTICYREDLSNLLKELPQSTSLSLGTILLILCACKDDWEKLYDAWKTLINIKPNDVEAEQVSILNNIGLKRQAHEFLTIINQLPPKYRTDVYRVSLLQTIFNTLSVKGYRTGLLPILNEFNGGEMDEVLFGTTVPLTDTHIIQDFAPLAAALVMFKDVESLEMKLRTGLAAIPKPVNLPQPEAAYKNLLNELEDDEKTSLVSQLAKQIMAALNIPMHLSGSSEQSLGGISDIANKGTYDKLLLSELAQDDLLLTARLANNEALFLKRETTPNHKTQELGIIIDSTLKMWGSARVFAIATCLAFRESKQPHQQLKTWSLGGQKIGVQELETKKDTVALMEEMDPALHCGEMLELTLQENIDKDGNYVFITSEHFLKDAASASYFFKNNDKLHYLVTISATGDLKMFRLKNKQSKLIHEANIDLNDLGTIRKTKKQFSPSHLPVVFQEAQLPIYYPTSKIKLHKQNLYVLKNRSVVAISLDQRVLYWPNRGRGAIELIAEVPEGLYCFGEIDAQLFLMLIPKKDTHIKIYNINLYQEEYTAIDIEVARPDPNIFKFTSPYFYCGNRMALKRVDPLSGEVAQVTKLNEQLLKQDPFYRDFIQNEVKKHLNNGYSTINTSKRMFLSHSGNLFSDGKEFILKNNQLYWQEKPKHELEVLKSAAQTEVKIDHLPAIKFTRFTWPGGSSALMDSRGVLHLRCANNTLAEVCIIMIVDQPTACWSADGYVSGSEYFTGHTVFEQLNLAVKTKRDTSQNYLEPGEFYERYIQPFIDSLK